MTSSQGNEELLSRVRTTAREFLDEAFSALERVHVLPVPWFAPHIRVGRDYYADNLAGVASMIRFEEAMVAAFPDHFAKPPPPDIEPFPHFYTYSFLEEVVRRNAALYKYGTSPDCVDEGVVSECVDELLAALSSPGFEMAACRVVSHLTTTTGNPMKIGDILVRPTPTEAHERWEVLRTIADVIPGSGAAASPDDLHYQKPGSVVEVRTKVKSWSHTSSTTEELSRRIQRFVRGIRLLTGATLASDIQIQGGTSRIGRIDPHMFDLRSPGIFNTLTHRVARLDGTDAEPIGRFLELLDEATASQQNKLISSLGMALAMFDRSHQLVPWFDRLVDLATALEAALIGDGDDNTGLRLRLRHRAAALLACETDPSTDLFKDVGELYDLRSTLIHGGEITTKTLAKRIARISTVSAGPLLGRATEQAVDRLRDIVRRAVLARISLSHGPNPLWNSEVSVDAVFADDQDRANWRSAWQEHMTEIGFPRPFKEHYPQLGTVN